MSLSGDEDVKWWLWSIWRWFGSKISDFQAWDEMTKCPSGYTTPQLPCDLVEKPLQPFKNENLSMGVALRSGVSKPLGKCTCPCPILGWWSGQMTMPWNRCKYSSGLMERLPKAVANPKSQHFGVWPNFYPFVFGSTQVCWIDAVQF